MKQPDLQLVDTNSLVPNAYNPNQMDDQTFNNLSSDVTAEGMDQPIVVRMNSEGKMEIVDGEHRWRAVRASGAPKVWVSLKEMDENEAKIATVRRNALRGTLDRLKFTNLVHSMSTDKTSVKEIQQRMGIADREFARSFLGQTEQKASASATLSLAEKNVAVSTLIANLSQMIRDIVMNNGDTIGQGFIGFGYKGYQHLLISMDAPLQKAAQEFISTCKDDGLSQAQISAKLVKALKAVSD